jgi:hypothetical protein
MFFQSSRWKWRLVRSCVPKTYLDSANSSFWYQSGRRAERTRLETTAFPSLRQLRASGDAVRRTEDFDNRADRGSVSHQIVGQWARDGESTLNLHGGNREVDTVLKWT